MSGAWWIMELRADSDVYDAQFAMDTLVSINGRSESPNPTAI